MKKILFLVSILIPSIVFAGPHVRNESQSTLYSAEGDTQPTSAVDRYGNQMCTMAAGTASRTNPIKLEDTAHTSGDAGIFALGVRNEAAAILPGTDADYSPLATNAYGVLYGELAITHQRSSTAGLLKAEDAASANGDAGVGILAKLQAALSVDAADGDYGLPKLGLDGRLMTALAPAGELWDSTSAADITTATTGTLKGSVASNRIYVHSWGCFNTGGAATRVYLEDGSGTRYSHCNLAATTGECFRTLPTPIRLPSASALNVNVVTAGSATRCEAHGYISVN